MLIVVPIQEHCPAPRPCPGLHVPPPVSHHEAAAKVDAPVSGRIEKQPRFRLAARALVSVVMVADSEIIQPHARADMIVYPFDCFFFGGSPRDIRLIRHANEQEARLLEEAAPLDCPLDEPHLREIAGRIRLPVTDNRFIEHAVPVEEDRPRVPYRTDSHFGLFACRAGCETMRCQMTAWKASECGVTVLGFTVGTITAQSATCAV